LLPNPETPHEDRRRVAMTYASLMADIGTLKLKPADWKALFLPPVHALPGS
jgi:hypothetical protein